ncbi:hypothetical protein FDENT_10991 [Fusarium denticulatum]|uniref:Ankyrin n=1 Tax=Fusarium denticulatum TaxID=48507 RepID=A0A8H5TMF9_9HYPO|nr:hypothetical protein FDENT_10991 [Fusarium denticulatum]
MADPLSLAASIAGLISLADLVFKTTYKFVRAAKDAKDEIQSLLDEINNLSSVLRRLEALTSDLEDEGQSFDPTLRNHYLNHCYKTFNKIESRVKKASDSFKKSKFDGIVRQLKWPFSVSETKEFLAELSRHKETISVALLADSMRKIQLSLSKLRHSMTGLWLTESPSFIRWLETPGSKLWLTGIPGAGKTVLAGSVVQEALTRSYNSRKIGVAFFFCDYKDSKTWNTVNILGALASQLARQNDESYKLLDAYHEVLYPPKGLPQTADADELRAKVSQMCLTFDQTIIVVDGLDECDDMTDEVVDNLIQLADYSDGLSMAFFSRDHYNIRIRLEEEFEAIQIAAHTEDVELYVIAEVDKRIRTRQLQLASVDMKEEIRSALVGKADGMFRWVVCQLDYLCDCAHDQERREALSKLPPDLPESYRRLLERVNNCSVGVQNMVQMCLHFMAVAEPKLTIVELQQAVSITAIGGTLDKDNIVPEYEIMKRCSSLIRKSTDGVYFEFAHFSVREFLEDEKAIFQTTGIEKYWVAQSVTNSLLATQCLKFLQMDNFDKMPDGPDQQVAATRQRDKDFPFYRHAALLWIKLTKDGLGDAEILELAKHLFRPSKPEYFMSWSVEVFKNVMYATGTGSRFDTNNETEIQAWRIVRTPSFKPLHMAAALNLPEICSFLISSGSGVNDKLDAATPLDLGFMSILAVPGLAEMSGKKTLHRDLMATGRNMLLPSAERRNVTIDYLMRAGGNSSGHLIPPNTLSVFSITCLFASIFNDLYPVFRSLCSHTIPSVPEVKVLKEWLVATDRSNHVAEESARLLLRLISSTGAYNTYWGSELGLIVWFLCYDVGRYLGFPNYFSFRYSGPVNVLLHLAVKHHAFDVFKALVKTGFDPYTYNHEGDFPIHLCERYGSLCGFRVFKDLGVSLTSQDQNGYSILHHWAQDRPLNYDFVNRIFELDPEGVIEGLQEKTPQGETPLTMIFESAGESPKSEHCDLDLEKLCLQILDLLQRQHRENGVEISLATETNVDFSRESFPEFSGMIRAEPTPLHKLKAWVSASQVQLLTKLYPDALKTRINGKLPVENYITETLKNFEKPEHNILLGAMHIYEEQFNESGLKPLLFNYQASQIPIIRDAILQTNYWNDMKTSQKISILFQDVIKSGNLDMIRLFVQKGANPHHRVYGQTPFEIALCARTAIRLCSTAEGTETLKSLLEYGSIDEIVKESSETDHGSPLHTLATSEDATNIIWLAEALVQHGFDIDYAGPGLSREIPLVHHLQQASFQFAEKLLKLGADPYARGKTSLNAVLTCVVTHNLSFLEKILDRKTRTQTDSCWSDAVTFSIRHLGQTAVVKNGNALHLVAACNSVACLELLLEHASEMDKASISDEGLTPVHIAAYEGYVNVLKLLQEGFNMTEESRFGFTPMHMAVLGGSLHTVQCLLAYGATQTLDANGRTPGRISLELGFGEIYELLEGNARGRSQKLPSCQKNTTFIEPEERLAMSFERAMKEDDYESMRQLINKGCPVDIPLPSSQGLPALLIALQERNLGMAEWLLLAGASALQANNEEEVLMSAIEIAAGHSDLNLLLLELFQEYLLEGGDLKFGYEFPLHEAVDAGNTKGLEILLGVAEDYQDYIGSSHTFRDVLNSLTLREFSCQNNWQTWTHIASTTALHIAAWNGNTEAITLLLKKGADIDAADSNGWTPLFYAKDADTAHHLISLGASMAAICRFGSLGSLINWFGDNLFDEVHPISFSRLPKEFLTVLDPPRFSTPCEELSLTPGNLDKLRELKFNLMSEDEAGRSTMHYILGEENRVDWVLGSDQDLSGITPFPWHLEWCQLCDLALLTSSFERLREKMPTELFYKVLNLEPSRGWSPLCHAAALNRVDVMAKFLEMGADMDFEGSCFGSAVMNASACGGLDAVKLLVRNGASVTYTSKKMFISCYRVAGTEAVREWLLSGRFKDQMRLASDSDSECLQEEVPWSGYVKARVLLYGGRARWPDESTLDYAKRLSKMKKRWQGQVIRLYVEEAGSSSGTGSDTGSEGEAGSNPEPGQSLAFESWYVKERPGRME